MIPPEGGFPEYKRGEEPVHPWARWVRTFDAKIRADSTRYYVSVLTGREVPLSYDPARFGWYVGAEDKVPTYITVTDIEDEAQTELAQEVYDALARTGKALNGHEIVDLVVNTLQWVPKEGLDQAQARIKDLLAQLDAAQGALLDARLEEDLPTSPPGETTTHDKDVWRNVADGIVYSKVDTSDKYGWGAYRKSIEKALDESDSARARGL